MKKLLNGYDMWNNNLREHLPLEPLARTTYERDGVPAKPKNTVRPGGVGYCDYKQALTNNVEEIMRRSEPVPLWLAIIGGLMILAMLAAGAYEINQTL